MAVSFAEPEIDQIHREENFAIICSFISTFDSILNLKGVTFNLLHDWIGNEGFIDEGFKNLLVRLIKQWRPSARKNRLNQYLIKFCRTYSEADALEIEEKEFQKCFLSTKLRVIKNLLESQFDVNQKLKNTINQYSAEELRFQEIGRDVEGISYWYLLDKSLNLHIYSEKLKEQCNREQCNGERCYGEHCYGEHCYGEQSFNLTARGRQQLKDLIDSLKRNKRKSDETNTRPGSVDSLKNAVQSIADSDATESTEVAVDFPVLSPVMEDVKNELLHGKEQESEKQCNGHSCENIGNRHEAFEKMKIENTDNDKVTFKKKTKAHVENHEENLENENKNDGIEGTFHRICEKIDEELTVKQEDGGKETLCGTSDKKDSCQPPSSSDSVDADCGNLGGTCQPSSSDDSVNDDCGKLDVSCQPSSSNKSVDADCGNLEDCQPSSSNDFVNHDNGKLEESCKPSSSINADCDQLEAISSNGNTDEKTSMTLDSEKQTESMCSQFEPHSVFDVEDKTLADIVGKIGACKPLKSRMLEFSLPWEKEKSSLVNSTQKSKSVFRVGRFASKKSNLKTLRVRKIKKKFNKGKRKARNPRQYSWLCDDHKSEETETIEDDNGDEFADECNWNELVEWNEQAAEELDFLESELEPSQEPLGRNAKLAYGTAAGDGDAFDQPCTKCGLENITEWVLSCDTCNDRYHLSCAQPAVHIIPSGDWFCHHCEHDRLIDRLETKLEEFDSILLTSSHPSKELSLVGRIKEGLETWNRNLEQEEKERIHQERLAFVSISSSNILPPHKKRLSRYSTLEDYVGYPHESVDRSFETAQEYSNGNSIFGLESSSSTTDIMNENFNKFTRLISSASATEIEDTAGSQISNSIWTESTTDDCASIGRKRRRRIISSDDEFQIDKGESSASSGTISDDDSEDWESGKDLNWVKKKKSKTTCSDTSVEKPKKASNVGQQTSRSEVMALRAEINWLKKKVLGQSKTAACKDAKNLQRPVNKTVFKIRQPIYIRQQNWPNHGQRFQNVQNRSTCSTKSMQPSSQLNVVIKPFQQKTSTDAVSKQNVKNSRPQGRLKPGQMKEIRCTRPMPENGPKFQPRIGSTFPRTEFQRPTQVPSRETVSSRSNPNVQGPPCSRLQPRFPYTGQYFKLGPVSQGSRSVRPAIHMSTVRPQMNQRICSVQNSQNYRPSPFLRASQPHAISRMPFVRTPSTATYTQHTQPKSCQQFASPEINPSDDWERESFSETRVVRKQLQYQQAGIVQNYPATVRMPGRLVQPRKPIWKKFKSSECSGTIASHHPAKNFKKHSSFDDAVYVVIEDDENDLASTMPDPASFEELDKSDTACPPDSSSINNHSFENEDFIPSCTPENNPIIIEPVDINKISGDKNSSLVEKYDPDDELESSLKEDSKVGCLVVSSDEESPTKSGFDDDDEVKILEMDKYCDEFENEESKNDVATEKPSNVVENVIDLDDEDECYECEDPNSEYINNENYETAVDVDQRQYEEQDGYDENQEYYEGEEFYEGEESHEVGGELEDLGDEEVYDEEYEHFEEQGDEYFENDELEEQVEECFQDGELEQGELTAEECYQEDQGREESDNFYDEAGTSDQYCDNRYDDVVNIDSDSESEGFLT